MAQRFDVFKCDICGNTVTMALVGGGQLVCCNKPMTMQVEKTGDQGLEKHVPVIKAEGDRMKVKVGETAHPMADDHYIQWIETISENGDAKIFLSPGDEPEREFHRPKRLVKVRAFCNLHGLWKTEKV
ncbi:desulfoferrodoxin [bacterium]|nr:desulfoferrodoxin [bacterium]